MTPAWLSWILSATSCFGLWLMGNKSKWGPRFGVVNQMLWIVYCIWTRQWGLMPGTLAFLVIHIRNLIRWEWKKDKTVDEWNYLEQGYHAYFSNLGTAACPYSSESFEGRKWHAGYWTAWRKEPNWPKERAAPQLGSVREDVE